MKPQSNRIHSFWQGSALSRLARRWLAPLGGVLAAAVAPVALAVDLQITDFSDTGYDPVPAGATVLYNVKVENGANDTTAGSVTIFDLPAGTALGSTAPAGCSASSGASGMTRVVCTNPVLSGSGAPYEFKLPVTTIGSQPATINVQVAIGYASALPDAATPITSLPANSPFYGVDTNTTNNRTNQTTTIQAAADLELSKSATPSPVMGGAEITYTLTVRNNGPSVTTGFEVVDTLPANVTLVGNPSGADWSFTQQNGRYNGTLAVGASTSYTFRGKVNVGSGNIVNAAKVEAGTQPGSVPDAVPDNNTAQVTTPVTAGADLKLSKSVSPAPAAAGSEVTYTLIARNDGPSAATSVVVTDAMPAGFVITGGTAPAGWTCSSDAGNSVRTCSLAGSFAPGGQADITITAQVPLSGPNSSGTATNTAQITAATPDPNAANNTGSVGLSVIPDGADLVMSKSKEPALVPVWNGIGLRMDSVMTSTLRAQNLGPRSVTGNLQLVDTLSPGEEWADAAGTPYAPGTPITVGNFTCVVDRAWNGTTGQVVTCTQNSGYPIAVNAPPVLLLLKTLARQQGTLANTACTGGSGGSAEPTTGGGINLDPNGSNDCASAQSRATDARADLSITKRTNGIGDSDNVMQASDDSVTFTLQVTNNGAATAGVVVNDPIKGFISRDTDVTEVSTPLGWTCGLSGSAWNCASGTTVLPANGSATIAFTVKRGLFDSLSEPARTCAGASQPAGRFCNEAGVRIDSAVAGSIGEANPNNNSATDWYKIDPVANVATTAKSITSGSPGRAGVNTTYLISYQNMGPSTARGVVFTDTFTLPANDAGFVLVSATHSGSGDINCSVTRQDAGIVSAPGAGGTSWSNTSGVPATLQLTCKPQDMPSNSTQSMTVVIRPNVDSSNSGRQFSNIGTFHFDLNGDGVADPASGVDANGTYNYNSRTDDDSRSAVLNFNPGEVDLIVNKIDQNFAGAVDPLGFDSRPGMETNNYFTYQVSVRNEGPSLATATVIEDTIAPMAGAEVRFIGSRIGNITTPQGALEAPGARCALMAGSTNPTTGPQTLSCRMPSVGVSTTEDGVIASRSTSYLYLIYQYISAPPSTGATILNTVTARSAETETNSSNNTAEQETSIRTRADLQMTKSGVLLQPNPDPLQALPAAATSISLRQPFWFALDVLNLGPGHSLSRDRSGDNPMRGDGAVITDTLPVGMEVIGGAQAITWQKVGNTADAGVMTNGSGTCDLTGQQVTCQMGDLALNGRARALIPARWITLPANALGVNTARIISDQVDPVPTNDEGTTTHTVVRSSLAGVVFQDSNRSGSNGGIRQAGEAAISGVQITLSGEDAYGNAVSLTTTTDTNGAYKFTDLAPAGTAGYILTQTQPQTYVNGPVAPPASGADAPSAGGSFAAVTPASTADSVYTGIALGAGVDAVRYNFPEVRRPSLSGVVYVDVDFSDAYGSGSDTPIAGATVELLNAADGSVIATTTDPTGAYRFNNLDPEITYTLREVLPSGGYRNRPSAINPGTINGQPCAAGNCVAETGVIGDAASTDRISNIDLSAGFDGINFNFGEDAVTSISGTVYVDRDNNKSLDRTAGDVGIAGVTVELKDGSGTVIATTTTDVDGNYSFADLVVGKKYTVVETQPAGYGEGRENGTEPGTGNSLNTIVINALPLAGSAGNNFGELLGSLAGFVFEDFSATAASNNNGLFDASEQPIANVTLALTGTDINGKPVSLTTTTAGDGSYRFNDLMPANAAGYKLVETQPAGYLDGKHKAGNGVVAGSNALANEISGINISAGQQASGYLFGELANANISGTVYLDRNDDGDQQAGTEPGIRGVTITIEGAGPDGVFGTSDDTNATVTTDASGSYSYGGAVAGQNYRITETQPTGLANGQENRGNVITISNLPSTGSTENNFGELAASLAGNVYLDSNNNGVRDAGEPALAGVQVNLPAGTVDALGNPVASVTTANDGSYRFDDLLAGTYMVTEQAAQPLYNGTTTLNGVTTAGTIDGVSAGTATAVGTVPSNISGIVLPAGKHSVSNDFAEILPVAASGTVFFDVNNDGAMAGVAETGIGAVQITLTGTDDLGNAVSLSTTTAADGTFSFEGLRPGTYTLTEPTQPAGTANGITTAGNVGGTSSGTATPVTTTPSAIASIDLTTPGSRSVDNLFGELPTNSGITGRVWEDRDNDGVVDPGEPGLPGVEVVLTGTDINGDPITPVTVMTDANGEYAFTDLPPGTYTVTETRQPPGTADGRTVPGSTGGTSSTPGSATSGNPSTITTITVGVSEISQENNFGEIPTGSISGKVYNDSNDNGIAENDEAGIANVVIELVGSDDLGNPVSLSTTTDADGNYRFDDLRPGTYTVTEPTQPAQTLNGITTAGSIGGTSVGSATGKDTVPSSISQIVLPIGGDSIHNNFGEIGDSPDMLVSKSSATEKLTVNNIASYTISVRNGGQKPSVGEYVVEDRLPVGLSLAAVPAGEGWTCAAAVGDTRFSCRSTAVVNAGATAAATINVQAMVSAEAAKAGVVNNAVIVSGGGENEFRTPTKTERDAFEGNVTDLPVCYAAITQNACRVPTPVQLSASVGGTVWFDVGSDDTRLDGGDERLPSWIVELVDPQTGAVVRTTTTAADGSYTFTDVIPGKEWNIHFRDPVSNVIWAWPVNQETAGGTGVSCGMADAIANGTASACRNSNNGISQLSVVLVPGEHLPQQSLPVDPSGVVYDAVSRDPVPGSIVTLTPAGMCAGYDPATAVLNAAAGGYSIQGNAISMTVGNNGYYQFVFGPAAPDRCEFTLSVTPPGGYQFVSTQITPESGSLNPPGGVGENWPVQPQPTAPTGPVGEGTRYWLSVISGSGTAGIIHNHIPLDTAAPAGLVITKTGDRQIVELGDTLQYTITVRQTAGSTLSMVNIVDTLPRGFTYIDGTARLGGRALNDPAGAPGPRLGFALGAINVDEQLALTYRVRVGVGALQGDGINRAQAHGCSINGGCISTDSMSPVPGSIPSNQAQYRVRVTGGVFSTEACVLGKVFVDCNLNHVQDEEELGIPGVRLYFSDGTWLVSDVEGKYSYCGLPANSHTLKVDASTLPHGSRLTTSSNRNLGDADSLFLDLKNGELHRADFIEGSCANPVLEQVKARRSQGEVRAPETEAGQPSLRFDSKPLRAPQQATDSANQRPIVQPRTLESVDASQEVQP